MFDFYFLPLFLYEDSGLLGSLGCRLVMYVSLCVFVPACVRACMSVCFSGLGILLSVNAGLCDLKSHLLN